MNKLTQFERLAKLLTRKQGVTSMEIISVVGTVCPHKRLSDLKARGWMIFKKPVAGRNFYRYSGVAPK